MSANAVKQLQLPSSPESPIRRLTPFHPRVIFSPAQPNRPHPPKPPDPPDPPDLVPSHTQLPTFVLRYPSPATDPNLSTHPSPSLKSRDFLSIPDCLSFLVIYAVVKLVCCQHAAGSELFSVHHRRSLSPLLWLRLRFLRQSAQSSAPMCSSAESAPATISQSFRHLMKPPVTLLTGGSPYNSVDPVNAHFEAHPVTSLSSLRGRDSSDVTPDRKLHSPMVQSYFTSDRIINMGQTQKLHTNWSPSRNLNVFISFHQTMKGLTQPFSYGKALQHSSSALERSLPHSSFLRERTLQSLFPLWKRLYPPSSFNKERTFLPFLFKRDLLFWVAAPRKHFNSFTILLPCVVVCVFVLVAISGGKDWFSKSQHMMTTPLDSISIASLPSTHLNSVSFLLSLSFENLSALTSFILSHGCNQRGWKIPSNYCMCEA